VLIQTQPLNFKNMDEKYLDELWKWTNSVDPTFKDRYTFDSWSEKIGNNTKYQQDFYKWVESIDENFSERRPYEEWVNLVKKKDETTELDSPQEEVVTTSDTEEVETPGVSDVSVSEEVVETAQEPSVETPEVVEQTTEEEVEATQEPTADTPEVVEKTTKEEVEVELDPDKLSQQQSQIDQVLAESFKVTSNVTELKKQNEIPLSILDAYGREIMMADNEVAAEGLQKIYNNHGFTFEDTGLGTMNVTAANGKETMIDTDTWTEDGAIEEAQKLKSFLQANKEEYEDITIETIYESTKKDKKEFLKYYDENLVNESIKDMNSRIGRFQDKGLEYEKNVKQFEKDYNLFIDNAKNGLLTPEQIKTQEELFAEIATGLESQLSELREDKTHLDDVKFKLNEIMGEHVALEAQKGNWVKSWWKSFVNTFDAKNASLSGGMIDIITTVMGEEGLDSLMPLIDEEGEFTGKRKDETNSEYRDRVSKQIKNELKPMIRTSLQDQITGGVTNEYQEQFQKTTWGMVSTAMAEMGAHMLASGGRSDVMAISFGLQINDAVFKEMESIEEFKNVSEAEKAGVAGLVSLTSGILESLGVSKILNKTGVSKSILFRALGKLGPKASYKSLENLIELEVKNILVKGGVKVIGSGLIEAETEVLQDISERSIKDIYNTLKEKEFFSKESTEITLANSLQSAKIGFLAGGGMGGMTASIQAYKQNGIDKLNIEQFELAKSLLTNPKTRQIYTDKIKIELADGTTTKSKAENEIKRMNEMVSIFNQIPKDIDVAGQQEAFALLQEKAALQKQIAGKNESLTKKERTRISDIDTRLERISETKTTTEEVVTEEVIEETPTTEVSEEISEVKPIEQRLEEGETISERNQEWDTQEKENLPPLNKTTEEFTEEIKKGTWGMLTAENPNAKQETDEFNQKANEAAKKWLKDKGYNPISIFGKYDNSEKSFYVPNLTTEDAIAFANEFNQESVATNKGLIYQDGNMNPINEGGQQIGVNQDNYYSTINTNEGPVDFSVSYDFDNITPATTEEVVTEEVVEETPVAEEVVEEKPSKERVDNIVDEIITKVEGRNFGEDTNPEVILESVQGYLQGSKFYEEATDIERESAVREINEKLEIKIPKAPSVKKILRKPKKKKVVVDEMAALKDQIKLEARAARGAVKDVNTKRKELAKQVKDLQKKGKITANQARVIINKINSVNLYNPKSVDAFVKYMEKVYNNAEYANKVMDANALRKRIKKGAKNKKKDAKLTELAKSFSAIDPKFVENIDEYLSVANSVLQGVVSSRVVGTDVNWRTSPDIVKVDKYINSQLQKQREILLENKRQEFETITGIAASELSYDDMMAILETTEEVDENKEKLVRDNVKKVFNAYKSIINNIISTGRDPFTGEKIDAPNKKIIKEFMDMDLNDLTVRESIEAVDALNNYVTNGITSGMETVVSLYRGTKNTKELVDKGVEAKPLRLFGLKNLGRITGEQITSLPILFERMFKGIKAGREVMQKIGFTDITNGVAKANKESNVIIDSYINKFSKTKPNDKVFNDAYNITERGLLGFMRRTVVGEDVQQQQEFDRRKGLVEQSIEKLETGTEQEQAKAKEYREVFDAVLKDAKSIEEVENNANKINVEAVKWWNEKWASYYDQLADVSLNVYNKILGSDVNYIPDSFRKTQEQSSEDFEWNESAFAAAQNALYQKKTGILEEATRPKNLPKDRYISLDFDTNNAALLEAALVDINTAAPIQQLKGSIESKYFNKLVPTKEDREVLISRLKGYVRRVRGKDFAGGTTAQEVNRVINFIAGLGVSRVLGGITQPIKQTIPVAINTLINAGRLDLKAIASTEINEWLDKSGYAIANRGLASETTLESINRALEKAAKSKGKKSLEFIEKANQMWLKTFLVKPDAAIARASWISYYKQSLKKQGINSSNIDWSTHDINKKAADYAQQQVDRQQNVSDANLQGDLMTSKKPIIQITRKVLIPFMNFVLNQKARMYSDIITLSSKTSSVEDKKTAARSLSGLMAETATFNALSAGITNMLFNLAKEVMGYDEPEEDIEKRMKNKKRGVATNVVTDVLVPFPILDVIILGSVNKVLDLFQMDIPDNEKFTLFNKEEENYLERAGVLGIAFEKLMDVSDIYDMAINGTITEESFGKKTTKELPAKSQEVMESILPLSILYNFGLLPSEVGSEIRYITKIAKKTAKTKTQQESAKKKKEKEEKESKRRKERIRKNKTRKRNTRTR